MNSNWLTNLLRLIAKKIILWPSKNNSTTSSPPSRDEAPEPVSQTHPWRLCGPGRHWVKTHSLSIPNSNQKTTRQGHCANNPQRKNGKPVLDYLNGDEINQIASREFKSLKNLPCLGSLNSFKGSEKYDASIQGWTKYWNEILTPPIPLDPNIVKALIASESSFNESVDTQNAGSAGRAMGLIQITDQAMNALGNPRGEIAEHFIATNSSELKNPDVSICAGVRWLHHKRKLASIELGREATWFEAIEKYKGVLQKSDEVKSRELSQFKNLFNILEAQCKK